jgi:hypothetical protein
MSKRRPLVFIELNEINMAVAKQYCDRGMFPNLQRLLQTRQIETVSEQAYQNLEPWIQWVSVHTGMSAAEHGVFRLGDMVGRPIPQLFEQLEAQGVQVGAISPMNVENRLRRPAYFVPDPWTQTNSDGSFWSRNLTEALQQAVNDNSKGKVTLKSLMVLAFGILRFAKLRNYPTYLSLAAGSPGRPWRKALFLDLFLHDLHHGLFARKRPSYSSVFLNAGAHVQHHYFFNSSFCDSKAQRNPDWYVSSATDPMAEMLAVYDRIMGDYLTLPNVSLIVATGLSQVPYQKLTYYWRLKDHANFLRMIGISFSNVAPRMTRDFLIEFESEQAAETAHAQLTKVCCKDQPVFEIDNRGDSLFVTLIWPQDVDDELMITWQGGSSPLKPHVAFVAIKNGMHSGTGYAYFKGEIESFAPLSGSHVKDLYKTVLGYFRPAIAPP